MEKNYLIYDIPTVNLDIFYQTGFKAPDAVLFVKKGNKKYLFLSDLEVDRAKANKSLNVVGLSDLKKKYNTKNKFENLLAALKKLKIKRVTVPPNFGVIYADYLRKNSIKINISENKILFPEREIKTKDEIVKIRKAQKATEGSMKRVFDILNDSDIIKNRIYYKGKVLTSEFLKNAIKNYLFERGYLAVDTIVACHNDSIEPHNSGSGPILPNKSIIVDIFPYDMETLYFADMTRTFVKGKATPLLKKQYAAVKKAKDLAFSMIKDGANAGKIHAVVINCFEKAGFRTAEINGRKQGFIHGTGHCLGLEIHEEPRINPDNHVLKSGNVITVEPGLYYENVGGVRIEDLVVVTKNGAENLTKFNYQLEIP